MIKNQALKQNQQFKTFNISQN